MCCLTQCLWIVTSLGWKISQATLPKQDLGTSSGFFLKFSSWYFRSQLLSQRSGSQTARASAKAKRRDRSREPNRPLAGSGHMVRNKLRWDANNAVGLSKQRNSYQSSPTFICYSRPSIIYSVPYDRILQRAYLWKRVVENPGMMEWLALIHIGSFSFTALSWRLRLCSIPAYESLKDRFHLRARESRCVTTLAGVPDPV